MASIDRRLHISVGRDQFLPVRLRVNSTSSGEFLFGEAQMHEVMDVLQQHVPQRLASLLQQRTPTRDVLDGLRGPTLTVCLTFQPTSSNLWLLGTEDDRQSRSVVPYTLLCNVQPLPQSTA